MLFSLALYIIWLLPATGAQRIGDIRLSGTCEGAVEIYATGRTTGISSFARLCDRFFGDREARVVCRQFGCNPVGARRTTGSVPTGHFLILPVGIQCTGLEWSLNDCGLRPEDCGTENFVAGQEDLNDFVSVKCGATVQRTRVTSSQGTTVTASIVALLCTAVLAQLV